MTGTDLDSPRLKRDLRAIQGDGVAFSLMVGVGETYLPAFALALGLGAVNAGLVAVLPMLAGAVLQLATPAAVRRLGSAKRWVVCCAAVQAVSFAPLVAGAALGRMPAAALFAVATLYWASGLGTGPAWNSWVSALVPSEIRPRFFARRSRMAQAAVLLGVVGGGAALHVAAGAGTTLRAFAVLFLIAGFSRVVSTAFLVGQSAPPAPTHHRDVGVRELLRRARRGADGRLLAYLLIVQCALNVAAPFFTPFMLEELKFSYAQYLLVISTSYIAKMIGLPLVGALVGRLGSQRVLYAAGLGIVPMSALWIFSQSLPYLIAVQVVGGLAWAAYELTTFLLLFERIDPAERTSVLTVFNLANAVATAGGALLGAGLLHGLGVGREVYLLLFALSGVLRLVSLPWLAGLRHTEVEPAAHIATRPLGVRPNTGSVDAPIVASMEDGS